MGRGVQAKWNKIRTRTVKNGHKSPFQSCWNFLADPYRCDVSYILLVWYTHASTDQRMFRHVVNTKIRTLALVIVTRLARQRGIAFIFV